MLIYPLHQLWGNLIYCTRSEISYSPQSVRSQEIPLCPQSPLTTQSHLRSHHTPPPLIPFSDGVLGLIPQIGVGRLSTRVGRSWAGTTMGKSYVLCETSCLRPSRRIQVSVSLTQPPVPGEQQGRWRCWEMQLTVQLQAHPPNLRRAPCH